MDDSIEMLGRREKEREKASEGKLERAHTHTCMFTVQVHTRVHTAVVVSDFTLKGQKRWSAVKELPVA